MLQRGSVNSVCALTRISAARLTLFCSLLLLVVTTVRADGPITVKECYTLNPTYKNETCTELYGALPAADNLFLKLPWSTVAEYQQCVQERCACSGQTITNTTVDNGIYCNAKKVWSESGYMTCDNFMACMSTFWTCATNVLMARYEAQAADFTLDEASLVMDIENHGKTQGQSFEVTSTYKSCRMITCEAAASRENCGLSTCLPDYSQCDEYIKPPPAPFVNQLCTEGCHVALYMMALTIVILTLSLACFCCCPSRVKVVKPAVTDNKKV